MDLLEQPENVGYGATTAPTGDILRNFVNKYDPFVCDPNDKRFEDKLTDKEQSLIQTLQAGVALNPIEQHRPIQSSSEVVISNKYCKALLEE